MGSAAVGELGTLLREKVFLVFFKKRKKKIIIQDIIMCTGSSLPMQDGVERDDKEDGEIRRGEIKAETSCF